MKVFTQKNIHLLNSPHLIIDAKTLVIVDANQAAVAAYGYTKEEFLKMDLFRLIPKSQLSELKKNTDVEKNQIINFNLPAHKKKNGELMLVQINAEPVSFNEMDCWDLEVSR
ncbi:MAG TPA: PAS domain-containing protein [Bacteroidia bacterium]|nr:PAS domain-containing protein [Bacteroidia bacterium]